MNKEYSEWLEKLQKQREVAEKIYSLEDMTWKEKIKKLYIPIKQMCTEVIKLLTRMSVVLLLSLLGFELATILYDFITGIDTASLMKYEVTEVDLKTLIICVAIGAIIKNKKSYIETAKTQVISYLYGGGFVKEIKALASLVLIAFIFFFLPSLTLNVINSEGIPTGDTAYSDRANHHYYFIGRQDNFSTNPDKEQLVYRFSFGEGENDIFDEQTQKAIAQLTEAISSCRENVETFSPKITISGFSSSSGSEKQNISLANQRAYNARKIILNTDPDLDKFITVSEISTSREWRDNLLVRDFTNSTGYNIQRGFFNRRVDVAINISGLGACDWNEYNSFDF